MTQREKEILDMIAQDPMIQQQTFAERLGITRSSVAVHISNLTKKGFLAGKGYVIRTGNYAAVVGGVNVDIGGRSYAPLVAADSNPGSVSITVGGVGRNIANNLALMGTDVKMLTAVGDDRNGQHALAHCVEQGMDMNHALVLPGATTSTLTADTSGSIGFSSGFITSLLTASPLDKSLAIAIDTPFLLLL